RRGDPRPPGEGDGSLLAAGVSRGMTSRAARFALLSILAAGVLFGGFSPASPESRWAVFLALASGAVGLTGRGWGVAVAAFAAAVAGGAAVLLKGAPQCPWSALIVLSFGAGFFFRDLVGSRAARPPDSRVHVLGFLTALWILAAAAAAVSARSLWALFHGLDLRVVNSRGMTDAEALTGNLTSLAAVLSGVVLFAVLRILDSKSARRALRALLAGAAASGLVAVLQARGWMASPRLPFWKMAGRLQGLCSDPNALGVLVGLAIPVAVAGGLSGARRLPWWLAAFALGGGLAASGSRSGFLVALGGSAILVVLRRGRMPARSGARSVAWVGTAAALALLAVIVASDRHSGGLLQRLASIFDRDVPIEFRASARPILWRGAWDAWRQNLAAGVGWNAFSWQLPNVNARAGAAMDRYDNPGNFYVQALAETGLAGIAILLAFVAAAARAIVNGLKGIESRDFLSEGAAAALGAFSVALVFGSHLLAAEVSCAAFVLLAQFRAWQVPSRRVRALLGISLAAAAVAWGIEAARTADPDYAFRYSAGIGFSAPENSREGRFQWSGRRCALRLPPGGRRRIRVVFRNPSTPAEEFRISSDRQELFTANLERNRDLRLTLVAPADRSSVFFFENAASFRPSAFGASKDSRELAMQVFFEP
ncbi:MAG: O-antigen ligase family protein, partial [Thermoanaerobaculia bacterium]